MSKIARLYIGTYTKTGESRGIYVYEINPENGHLSFSSTCESENPSFLAINNGDLYAANELDNKGRLSAHTIDSKTGALSFLNAVDTPGEGMCHISIWPNKSWISAANYMSGSFVTCSILPDGRLGEVIQVIQSEGSGPNKVRQAGPHAHFIIPSPGGRHWIGTDLGSDRLLLFCANLDSGQLTPNPVQPWVTVSPGDGPRHFTFHPNGHFGYLVTELTSRVLAYSYDPEKGTLKQIQAISALQQGWAEANPDVKSFSAAIRISPDGRYLYASNRGADNIAAFAVDSEDGTLESIGFFPSHGRWPRDFCISPDGCFIVITNQNSNNLVICRRDVKSGVIGEVVNEAQVPLPVSVLWYKN